MLAVSQGLLIVGLVVVALTGGFLLATALFVVQLRRAQRRIAQLESGELLVVEPGVVRLPPGDPARAARPENGAAQGKAQVDSLAAGPGPASVPGWTVIVMRDVDSSRQQPETLLVPAGIAGRSGGMFATEEAAESFRSNHLTRFDALQGRLDALRAHCAADIAGGGAEIARRLITLSSGDTAVLD